MRKPMSVATDFDQRREGVQEVVVRIRGQPYTARNAIKKGSTVAYRGGGPGQLHPTPPGGPSVPVFVMADNGIGLVRRCGAATTR